MWALGTALAEGFVEVIEVFGAFCLAFNLVLLSGHFILQVGKTIVLPSAERPYHVLALDTETTHTRALLAGLLAVIVSVLSAVFGRHAFFAHKTANQKLWAIVCVVNRDLATSENLLTVFAGNFLFLTLKLVNLLDVAEYQVGTVSAGQREVRAICIVVSGHSVSSGRHLAMIALNVDPPASLFVGDHVLSQISGLAVLVGLADTLLVVTEIKVLLDLVVVDDLLATGEIVVASELQVV